MMNLNFYIITGVENPHVFDMITYMLGQFPALNEAGVSGYPIIFNAAPSILDGGETIISGLLGKVVMVNTTKEKDILNLFEPLFEHINATWPGFYFFASTKSYPTFYSWYEENYDNSTAGYEMVMGSRLLDAPSLTNNATAVKEAFEVFSAAGQATVYMVAGKGVSEAQPRGGGNSVNPAWRVTVVHASESTAPHFPIFACLLGDEVLLRSLSVQRRVSPFLL